MRSALTLISFLLFCMPALAGETNQELVTFNKEKALAKAKELLYKNLPKYVGHELRLVELTARYRPSTSQEFVVEVSFIDMDTIGNVKADQTVWKQASTGKEMTGLVYEHIVVKLPIDKSLTDSVKIINMKYPGTKEQLVDSIGNL